MIGKKIKANASFPIDSPEKVSYGVITAFILLFLVFAVYLASSLSL